MYTRADYLEQYRENNKALNRKKARIEKLMGYIEERLSKSISLGCPVARFYCYQLSPTLWEILSGDDVDFVHRCEDNNYMITTETGGDGVDDIFVDITSSAAEQTAKFINLFFSQCSTEDFCRCILARMFKEGQEKNVRYPRYIIHKDSCSDTIWKLATSTDFGKMVGEYGWNYERRPDSVPYVAIS